MLDNKIYVIDDMIDVEYQNAIKNVLMGSYFYKNKEFPWFYISDVTDSHNAYSQNRSAMCHKCVYYNEETNVSKRHTIFHSMFICLLLTACKRMDIKNVDVLQGRSFLQFPLNLKDKTVDTPHIDIKRKHFVVLYYVCDSDGDTIIYNERELSDSYTVKESVTPKQGRTVIFDGSLYHTAQQPMNNIRCVVNYNLLPRNPPSSTTTGKETTEPV